MTNPGIFIEDRYLTLNDGNAYDALVLARIIQAFAERSIERKDGCWLPMPYATLATLCGMPEATVRKSVGRMVIRGIMGTLTFGHNGVRTLHIQMLHRDIIEAIKRPNRTFDCATETPLEDSSDEQMPQEDITANAPSAHLTGEQTPYEDVSYSHTAPRGHLPDSEQKVSPNNPIKKTDNRKPELIDSAKGLLESWNLAHPENRRPKKVYTWENISFANQLYSEGFTIQEVDKMTAQKINSRSGGYAFRWLTEDLREQRRVQKATAPTNGASTPEEIEAHFSKPITPEPASNGNHDWQLAYSQFREQLGKDAFERVRDAKPITWEGDILIISVPTEFDQRECQNKHYRSIRRIVGAAVGKPVELRFEVARAGEVG